MNAIAAAFNCDAWAVGGLLVLHLGLGGLLDSINELGSDWSCNGFDGFFHRDGMTFGSIRMDFK